MFRTIGAMHWISIILVKSFARKLKCIHPFVWRRIFFFCSSTASLLSFVFYRLIRHSLSVIFVRLVYHSQSNCIRSSSSKLPIRRKWKQCATKIQLRPDTGTPLVHWLLASVSENVRFPQQIRATPVQWFVHKFKTQNWPMHLLAQLAVFAVDDK